MRKIFLHYLQELLNFHQNSFYTKTPKTKTQLLSQFWVISKSPCKYNPHKFHVRKNQMKIKKSQFNTKFFTPEFISVNVYRNQISYLDWCFMITLNSIFPNKIQWRTNQQPHFMLKQVEPKQFFKLRKANLSIVNALFYNLCMFSFKYLTKSRNK